MTLHRKRSTRLVSAAAGLLGVLLLASACSTIAEPDQVGLYYLEGQLDGYKFGHCIDPGAADDAEWNNSVVYLPTSLRTWNIAEDDSADSKTPVTVSSAPELGQPSGVQVNVWSQTNLILNTNCDDVEGSKGGTLRRFWETLGRRYSADTSEGWRKMMLVTVVPALEKSTRSVVRQYKADDLVANKDNILATVQTQIAEQFASELERLSGGKFFCGPSFVRGKVDCPSVELIIKNVEFADDGIQQARNDKQKALEQAAAAVAAAQGQVDAAKKLGELYGNKAWLELEKAKLQLQIAEACAQSAKCQMVMGTDGNIQVHTQ